MNKAFEKAIASARYFKNKGETDMWHCIWHDGKPYDYHLYVEDGVSEVYIYDVDKINNEYKVNTDKTIHIHKFKPSSKMKTYNFKLDFVTWHDKNFMIEAKNEEEAKDKVQEVIQSYRNEIREKGQLLIHNKNFKDEWMEGDYHFDLVYLEEEHD